MGKCILILIKTKNQKRVEILHYVSSKHDTMTRYSIPINNSPRLNSAVN